MYVCIYVCKSMNVYTICTVCNIKKRWILPEISGIWGNIEDAIERKRERKRDRERDREEKKKR